MTSNAVPPAVTPPSPFEWPQNLVVPITGISNDSIATITAPNHGFQVADQNAVFMTFKQVQGMLQINGISSQLLQVIDINTFTTNINTTNFYIYRSGGVICIDTPLPTLQQQGFQFFNQPFQNIYNS